MWRDHSDKHSSTHVLELVTGGRSVYVFRQVKDTGPWRVTCNYAGITGEVLAAVNVEDAKEEALRLVVEAALLRSREMQDFSFAITTARGEPECSQSMS